MSSRSSGASSHTTSTAANENVPANAARRRKSVCSASVSVRWLQSSVAASVRWCSGTPLLVWRSNEELPRSRRSEMSEGCSTDVRAAASSSASGSPSSCQQMRTIASRFASVSANAGATAAARSTNSCTAGASPAALRSARVPRRSRGGIPRPSTRATCSPGIPSGWREVVMMRRAEQAASTRATSSPQASITCSQLSSTSSVSGPPRLRATTSMLGPPATSPGRNAAATTCATSAASDTAVSSTHHAPPGVALRRRSARASPSRLLPEPPGPQRLSRRV